MRPGDLLFHTLQYHSAVPADQLAAAWRQLPEAGLTALISYERAEAWTLRRLKEIGADAHAPAAFVAALKRHTREESARNMLVDAETGRVVDRLRQGGVPFVLLKGTARRALAAQYPGMDARATSDVDVLVPADAAARAWEDLRAAGYRPSSDQRPHHLAPLVGTGSVAVELHTSMAHGMAPEEAWRRATAGGREITWDGRQVPVPSATELLWHGLAHALQLETPLPWRLRYFLEGAALLAGEQPVEWSTVAARLASAEVPDALQARAWLGAAASLACVPVPAGPLDGTAAFDLGRALRWRLSVLARRENRGLGARLLEEGTRAALRLPHAPPAPGSGLLKATRRRLGGRAARMMYRMWRARDGREDSR